MVTSDSPVLGSKGRVWLFLGALLLAEMTSAFEVAMIYAAMPRFIEVFGDPAKVGWVLTGCLMVAAVSAALCARLGDLYGRRKVLLIMLCGCAAGSLISATSGSLAGVILGTSIQGLSGAVLPLCFGLLRERLDPKLIPTAVGIIVTAVMAGGGGGLLLGGWLIDSFDWNAIFYFSGLLAILGIAAVLLGVPYRAHVASVPKMDAVRGVLFAPGLVIVMYGITQSRVWGLFDPRTIALLGTGIAILVYWVRHQWNEANPLIDVRLACIRPIGASYACMAFVGMGAFQFSYVLSLYLQQPAAHGGMGLSATATGAILGPALWLGSLGGPISGRISNRFGSTTAAMVGATMLTAGWLILIFARHELWVVVAVAIMVSTGLPIVYAALPSIILSEAPPDRVSEAAGINSVMRAMFSSVGAALVAFLIASGSASGETPYPSSATYSMACAYVALMSAAALVMAFLSGRRASARRQEAMS